VEKADAYSREAIDGVDHIPADWKEDSKEDVF
jgi:hypothetical protein